ncbi:DUF488 domain-containing protein [Micromonospora sp. WMMD1102]|uniref:DUF488 domain-containing protein n=1 Tax=Micromonospora sp. WMMD1102 TaxID=3016105 RepID=UPI0024158544|nr:DUF488 domain-containing protein [Micromonospora sp. WMMD1102]MDG4790732.1 DUF488 domain-containing protein [Micromonospora sp. WMMD1102]MDG4792179.1 DUF488 domain-containing protein [Micromonospora sp. WMMD1102]
MTTVEPGLIGVGYEGQTIDRFVAHMLAMGVARLVDVRLTPISRKPGFSKSALSRAIGDVGISYEHRRELGNPKTNRSGFAGAPEELAAARAFFAEQLREPAAVDALDAVAEAGLRELVAVLCFEADQRHCHRDVVLQAAQDRLVRTSGASRRRGC